MPAQTSAVLTSDGLDITAGDINFTTFIGAIAEQRARLAAMATTAADRQHKRNAYYYALRFPNVPLPLGVFVNVYDSGSERASKFYRHPFPGYGKVVEVRSDRNHVVIEWCEPHPLGVKVGDRATFPRNYLMLSKNQSGKFNVRFFFNVS